MTSSAHTSWADVVVSRGLYVTTLLLIALIAAFRRSKRYASDLSSGGIVIAVFVHFFQWQAWCDQSIYASYWYLTDKKITVVFLAALHCSADISRASLLSIAAGYIRRPKKLLDSFGFMLAYCHKMYGTLISGDILRGDARNAEKVAADW